MQLVIAGIIALLLLICLVSFCCMKSLKMRTKLVTQSKKFVEKSELYQSNGGSQNYEQNEGGPTNRYLKDEQSLQTI